MSEATGTVLIVITSLSALTSAATLTLVVLGGKNIQTQVDTLKAQFEATRKKTKEFLSSMDL